MTILPINISFNERELGKSIFYFPIVGVIIGAFVAGITYLLTLLTADHLILSFCSVSMLALLTGGLHLDGVADSADGLLSARSRERMLEIMRDSRIGAMGVLGLLFVLGLKFVALQSLELETLLLVLFVVPIFSRSMIVLSISLFPYAREKGMASLFVESNRHYFSFVAFAFSVSVIVYCFGENALFPLCSGIVVFLLFNFFCKRKLGGITGDTLGALVELSEGLCFLVIALGME